MQNPEGEANLPPLRLHFDRRLKLEFHGSETHNRIAELWST